MLVRRLIFSFWVILSIGAIVLSSYRNAARPVQGFVVHMDDQYPQMISKDSVDKMLTLVFKDSTSKRKSEINLKRLELRLAQNNLIKKTEAFLTLDDTLHIKVFPRIPVARVQGETEFYLDSEGSVIPLSPTYDPEVPIITNTPDIDRYQALSSLSIAIANDNFLASHIVDIKDFGDQVYMNIVDHDYRLKIKSVDDMQTKFKKYKVFYAAAIDQGIIDDYSEVALDYSDQIICKRNTL
ncbi:MAG: cell division protein FtsQ/DivIB [Flavobacteriaceae bacterium]|jgi:cell division protein FtsQ